MDKFAEIRAIHSDYLAYECIVHGGSGANKNDGFYRDGHRRFQEFMIDEFPALLDALNERDAEIARLRAALESIERTSGFSGHLATRALKGEEG